MNPSQRRSWQRIGEQQKNPPKRICGLDRRKADYFCLRVAVDFFVPGFTSAASTLCGVA